MTDIMPQHEFAGGHVDNRCRALFDGTRGNTWECGMPRENDIHLVEIEQPEPVEPQRADGLSENAEDDLFTVPTDGATANEIRLLEQDIDQRIARLSFVPTEHARAELHRLSHVSNRIGAIAFALEEGRLQIHPRTIDHQVAREAWLMKVSIPETKGEHGDQG